MAKSTWGGSRPGNPNKTRGGARTGAGRMVRRIQLDKDTAAQLRTLVMNRRAVTDNPALSEDEFVSGLIRAAYAEYDAAVQEAVEMVEDANV